jgi:hypothetical protein
MRANEMVNKLKKVISGFALGITGLLAIQSQANATSDLASAATNPAAALIQLQLQDSYIPKQQNGLGDSNSGIIQPVYPFVLGPDHYFQSVITRTTIPIVTTPNIPKKGRTFGLGDTVAIIVPTHKEPIGDEGGFFTWGPMLGTTIPTATTRETGAGKVQLGPGLLGLRNWTKVLNDGDSVLLGAFGYQQWSVADGTGENRASVSKGYWAPVAVYHFNEYSGLKNWYAALPDDLWRYDWKANKWDQIPVGGRVGKVFAIGKQPINAFFQGWYNAANKGTSEYALKLNVTFLFPE